MNPPSTSAQPAAAVSTVFFCKQGDISEERNSYYLQQTLVIQYMQKKHQSQTHVGWTENSFCNLSVVSYFMS